MSSSPEAWLRRLLSAFTASAQLLAPGSAACLLCGKPQQSARSAAAQNHSKLPPQLRKSVCGACLSAIPWIARIRCAKCGRGIPCDDCIRRPHPSFVCNRSAVHYNDMMRGVLAQYKYRGNERLAPLLGGMLQLVFEALTAEISAPLLNRPSRNGRPNKLIFADHWTAVTYVPISEQRAADRGFNQAEQLASQLAHQYGIPLLHLLIRERHTEKQSFKTRSERIRDTQRLFGVNQAELAGLYHHKPVLQRPCFKESENAVKLLLIDDIYTTGSTAEACSNVLQQYVRHPLEIYVLTWARS